LLKVLRDLAGGGGGGGISGTESGASRSPIKYKKFNLLELLTSNPFTLSLTLSTNKLECFNLWHAFSGKYIKCKQ
jgi:hypothetical protein